MSLIRLLVPYLPNVGERAPLEEAQYHHLIRVRRKEAGDKVIIQTPEGKRALAEVGFLDKSPFVVCLEKIEDVAGVLPIRLYPALLPDSAFTFLLQKATEIGVKEITPTITEFTVAKVGDEKKKMLRWQKVCDEAACQCGGVPARVKLPMSFREVLEKEKSGLRILADGSGVQLKDLLEKPGSVALLIGPEGGHSLREMDEAVSAGFIKTAFHPFILRAETAAVVCSAMLQQRFGEL
ncbi:16S rRNA (uracil(1498)-N(3))-methyltransferase [bacterium]|nr:16S rRNA (uracil(1498)-N(3))-methyltransferase [bacterium]